MWPIVMTIKNSRLSNVATIHDIVNKNLFS